VCTLDPLPPPLHHQACAFKLQDAILSSRGVVRLMDMLAEREVIRNEALLLLVALTQARACALCSMGRGRECVCMCVHVCVRSVFVVWGVWG